VALLFLTLAPEITDTVNGQIADPYIVTVAFPNLSFNQPTGLIADPVSSNRLFVLEQTGTIRTFQKIKNASDAVTFLDISSQVLYGGEQGILGLAFHPNCTTNPYFYINYVADNPRRTVIARYTIDPNNPDQADPDSQRIILEIPQPPFSNHKGGQLAFGSDGYLYIGVGDGGSAGDPLGNGQNRQTLLGKILRIDITQTPAERNYGIPPDNPHAGNSLGYREEIYAYGFRNPWRFSFDSATGQLWVADVGQSSLEEIDLVENGKNYGWNIMEGTACFNPPGDCDQTGLTLPVYNYTHDDGNAIIGGYVYHGQTHPGLQGAYIYGDFGSGRIWALCLNGTELNNEELVDSGLSITSFGVDQDGELYFTAYDGRIYELMVNPIPEFPSMWVFFGLLGVLSIIFTVAIIIRKRFAHLRVTKTRLC